MFILTGDVGKINLLRRDITKQSQSLILIVRVGVMFIGQIRMGVSYRPAIDKVSMYKKSRSAVIDSEKQRQKDCKKSA